MTRLKRGEAPAFNPEDQTMPDFATYYTITDADRVLIREALRHGEYHFGGQGDGLKRADAMARLLKDI